jgi:hypothetical protein
VVRLLAVELDDRLVAQIERRSVEGTVLEGRDGEDALVVVPLREEIRTGWRLLADEQLLEVFVAGSFELDLDGAPRP